MRALPPQGKARLSRSETRWWRTMWALRQGTTRSAMTSDEMVAALTVVMVVVPMVAIAAAAAAVEDGIPGSSPQLLASILVVASVVALLELPRVPGEALPAPPCWHPVAVE